VQVNVADQNAMPVLNTDAEVRIRVGRHYRNLP
jgi:hypothetical protein